MSFLDKAKQALGQAKGRAGHLAGQHGDKIDQAIDKGSGYLDQRTSGKYSDKIHRARDSAKGATTKLADQHRESEPGATTNSPEEPAARVDPPQPTDPVDPSDHPDPNRESRNRP